MIQSYWNNESDPYQYPGTGVLRNIPGIKDGRNLETFEQRATSLRLEEAVQAVSGLPLNFALWQTLHRVLFQDVYEWAGHVRTVQIAKGNTVFAMPLHIEAEADRLFGEMNAEQLIKLDHSKFSSRLAYYFAELNVLHPFREGNGRTQKLVFDEITRRAGFDIDWETISVEKLLEALVLTFRKQDYSQLEALFKTAIAPNAPYPLY